MDGLRPLLAASYLAIFSTWVQSLDSCPLVKFFRNTGRCLSTSKDSSREFQASTPARAAGSCRPRSALESSGSEPAEQQPAMSRQQMIYSAKDLATDDDILCDVLVDNALGFPTHKVTPRRRHAATDAAPMPRRFTPLPPPSATAAAPLQQQQPAASSSTQHPATAADEGRRACSAAAPVPLTGAPCHVPLTATPCCMPFAGHTVPHAVCRSRRPACRVPRAARRRWPRTTPASRLTRWRWSR